MHEIPATRKNISTSYDNLTDEINYLILKIKLSESFIESQIYFESLFEIELFLSKLIHSYGISMPKSLNVFLTDFKTVHDANEQEKIFDLIKKDQFRYDLKNEVLLFKLLAEMEASSTQKNIKLKLNFLYQQILLLLLQIENCKNIIIANAYFDQLQQIQTTLAIYAFKYEIEMTNPLYKFISDCDRLDDPWLREFLFDRIKNGKYIL